MTELEIMRQWLLSYPAWDEGGLLYIDYTDGLPGNSGLFPGGIEQLQWQEDVLGNVKVRNRCNFTLYRICTGQEDNTKNARWMLQFQSWIRQQCGERKAPAFGDEPHTERIRAENGRRYRDLQTGTATYVVTLSVEYTKYIYK